MEKKHRRPTCWRIVELELSEPIQPISVACPYEGARVLVRHRGRPVGWLSLPCARGGQLAEAQLCEALGREVGGQLLPVLLEGGEAAASIAGGPEPISVVVCTRNRTAWLEQCLDALQELDYPAYEVIVVDNAPSNDDTLRLVEQRPARYVREEQPGLDWARNRGIAAAQYDLIAFTDDDARPDRGWLRAIAAAFAEPEVMAVTGLVAPAELETEAQCLFELGYGGMGHGFGRRIIRKQSENDWSLLWASVFGVGANMAFRRTVFAATGRFDVALDVGTPSGGGGDIELFQRLVASGATLVYEPAALVWHCHRRDRAALRRQVYNNGRSFGAYLLTCARNRTVRRRAILYFALRHWLHGWLVRRLARPGRWPRRLVAAELAGALCSPWAYAAARIQARSRSAALHKETTGRVPI